MDQEQNTNPTTPGVQSAPSQNPFPQPMKTEGGGVGPIIGGIVVLIVVIAAAWYFLAGPGTDNTMMLPPATTEGTMPENTDATQPEEADATTEALNNQGSTDDVSSIEADLNATDVGSAGADIESI